MGLAGNIRRLQAKRDLRDPNLRHTPEGYYELQLAATGDKEAAEKAMAKFVLAQLRDGETS